MTPIPCPTNARRLRHPRARINKKWAAQHRRTLRGVPRICTDYQWKDGGA